MPQKLIDKFNDMLNLDRKKQKEKRKKFRTLLKGLKQQQRELEEQLKKEKDTDKKKRIKRYLKVIYAQRTKAVKLCRSIKCH